MRETKPVISDRVAMVRGQAVRRDGKEVAVIIGSSVRVAVFDIATGEETASLPREGKWAAVCLA